MDPLQVGKRVLLAPFSASPLDRYDSATAAESTWTNSCFISKITIYVRGNTHSQSNISLQTYLWISETLAGEDRLS